MPGTRARRASQYRAWARSLKLVGQRPTPANGVKYRSTACLKAHRRPFVSQAADQLCPTGCSKRPDFLPTQPWRLLHPPALSLPRQPLRPKTRLVTSKAAANYHFIRGGWDDPNCAQCSHPPTHWHAETCHLPRRGSSSFPHFALRGAARLSFTARIGRAPFYRARSASTKDGLAAPLLLF